MGGWCMCMFQPWRVVILLTEQLNEVFRWYDLRIFHIFRQLTSLSQFSFKWLMVKLRLMWCAVRGRLNMKKSLFLPCSFSDRSLRSGRPVAAWISGWRLVISLQRCSVSSITEDPGGGQLQWIRLPLHVNYLFYWQDQRSLGCVKYHPLLITPM